MKLHSKIKELLPLIFIFLICLVVGASFGLIITHKLGGELSFLTLCLRMFEALFFFALAFVIQVIGHESGHMVAALIRGWKFVSFMLFSFVLSRKDGRWRISRFNLEGALGQCIMMPPVKGDTNAGILFYNAGGLIVNLLLVIIPLGLLIGRFDALSFEGTILCLSLTITGLFFGLTNGIPLKVSGLPNDGLNMMNLHKDPFSTRIFLSTIRITGMLFKGLDVKDNNEGYLCDGHKIDYTNPIHVMGKSFDMALAMGKMDFDKANEIWNTVEPYKYEMVDIYRKEMTFDKIYLTLIAPHEKYEVERLLTKGMNRYIEIQSHYRPVAIRVQYALALLHEHDEEKAQRIYEYFIKFCSQYYIPGEVLSEKRLVEYIRQL